MKFFTSKERENTKDTGMCSHGNFRDSCDTCKMERHARRVAFGQFSDSIKDLPPLEHSKAFLTRRLGREPTAEELLDQLELARSQNLTYIFGQDRKKEFLFSTKDELLKGIDQFAAEVERNPSILSKGYPPETYAQRLAAWKAGLDRSKTTLIDLEDAILQVERQREQEAA